MAIREVGPISCECTKDPELDRPCIWRCEEGIASLFYCCSCEEDFDVADETPYWSGSAYACRECAQKDDDAMHEDLCVAAMEASTLLFRIAKSAGAVSIKELEQISENLDNCVSHSRGEEI